MRLTRTEVRVREVAATREAQLGVEGRRRSGAVHTPPELARAVCVLLDRLLREELSLPQGVASDQVALIDPACGPGAFFAGLLSVARGRASAPSAVVGLELHEGVLGAGRAALAPAFARAGWPLELRAVDALDALSADELAARGRLPVVVGNPPWMAGAQARPAPALARLLGDFRRDHTGAPLGERKLGVLSDAYVRFLRFGAEIARLGELGGALALLTNSSYLDGPVHRGLRAALLRWFTRVVVVDLGGNALIARRGTRDDNLFGVRPGAALLLATRSVQAKAPARYSHCVLRGSARDKLRALCQLGRQPLAICATPAAPFFSFVSHARACREYDRWPALSEAMPFSREGVQTNRDAVVVDTDRERLIARLGHFVAGHRSPELSRARHRLPHYDPAQARRAVQRALQCDPDGTGNLLVRSIAYRPFDTRWFAPIAPLCHRPRPALLSAMAHSAFALVSVRKDRGREPWAHVAAAGHVIDNCFLSARSSCRARAFPTHGPTGEPNLDPQVAAHFAERVGRPVEVELFALYCLGRLWEEAYRARHVDALRSDYPRIPWPRDAAEFDAAARAGAELLRLFHAPIRASVTSAKPASSDGAALTIGHHRLQVPPPVAARFFELARGAC